MKSGSSGSWKCAADVTKHLAAARMLHGLGLGHLLRIFTFTDRGVIVCELAQAVARQFAQRLSPTWPIVS